MTKAEIIAAAAGAASHQRTDAKHKPIMRETITLLVGSSKELLESIKPNQRSAAIRAALKYADTNNQLSMYKV